MTWEEQFARVVYQGGHSIFFDRFVQAVNVHTLVIVSPWVQTLQGESMSLVDIIRSIEQKKAPTTVVMRDPKREPLNKDADALFRDCPYVSLYYNNDLHAKIYVCRCEPFGFALLGSANLSGHAIRALEIGLLIEGKGAGGDIVEELERLGRDDIPNRSGSSLSQLAQRRRFG